MVHIDGAHITAAAAHAAANVGGTAKAAYAMKELAKLSTQLSHEELQALVAQSVLEGLRQCEFHAKKCVRLLVDALRSPDARVELVADAMWTLNKLAQQCPEARPWIMEVDGLGAVHNVLVVHCSNCSDDVLISCSIWLVHALDGIRGLTTLLNASNSDEGSRLPDKVVSVLAWAIHGLMKPDGYTRGNKAASPEELAGLIKPLVEVLARRGGMSERGAEVRRSCCAALDATIHEDPRLGALLIDYNGVPLLLDALRYAITAKSDGNGAGNNFGNGFSGAVYANGYNPAVEEDLARNCVFTIATLVQSSSMHTHAVRQYGAAQVLAQLGTRGRGTTDEEAAIWALGHVAGIGAVVQAITHAPTLPAVIRGGLDAITELCHQITAEADLTVLPEVLKIVLGVLMEMNSPTPKIKCHKKSVVAATSVAICLAPHAGPGALPELDQIVELLLNGIKVDPRTDLEYELAEKIVEMFGRLALLNPAWREGLHRCSAIDVVTQRIRGTKNNRRFIKMCFWAAAAVRGLPFVCEELIQSVRTDDIVDAAFCTIIDILDDDLEGDWVLKEARRCNEHDIPSVLKLISQAMDGYPSHSVLQARGCRCVGLLVGLAPLAVLPSEAIASTFSAARRHPRCPFVLRDACFAFRAFIEPGSRVDGALHQAIVKTLRDEGVDQITWAALRDHASSQCSELIEEAVIVLTSLAGVELALNAIAKGCPGPVGTVGVKALCELGRLHPDLLRPYSGQIVAKVTAMTAECPTDEALRQNAALLVGLCQR